MAAEPASSGAPDPSWRSSRADGRRRMPLGRDAIVDAAMAVLDAEGIDALSMRRLAQELETGAASLYWHVRGKDELIDLVVDRVIAEVALPGPPDPAAWQEQVKEVARAQRAAFRRHHDLARVTLGRVPFGPSLVAVIEALLGILKAGGVPDRLAGCAGDLLTLYVAATAYEDALRFRSASGEECEPRDVSTMFREHLASLPAERFPLVVALTDHLVGGDADERFELGLDVIVAGLAAFATR